MRGVEWVSPPNTAVTNSDRYTMDRSGLPSPFDKLPKWVLLIYAVTINPIASMVVGALEGLRNAIEDFNSIRKLK